MPRFPSHPERRAAVVTGASSGIGRATAELLAAAGHPVVLGARRLERLEEVADSIRAAGGKATPVPLDLTDAGSVESFAERANELAGPIEIVVSNAGEAAPLGVLTASPDEFARQVDVNLLGPHRLVHALVPAMVARGRGDVVFVTSEAAVRPRPHMAPYAAAKAGLEAMATTMRMELEGSGVRVGIVRPGPSATEQGSNWDPELAMVALTEWERWGFARHAGTMRPRDVAAAVVAMVGVPRGTSFHLLEVLPEAPVPGSSLSE